MKLKRFSFENTYYKDEWLDVVPRGDKNATGQVRYKDGTAISHDNDVDKFAVYDGAGNIMGDINSKGETFYAGDENEYKYTFLKSAAEKLAEMTE